MKVRFPMYIQAVAYQEIEIPDAVNPFNEEEVRELIDEKWDSIPLPDNTEWEYISDDGVDWEAPIEIIDDKGIVIN